MRLAIVSQSARIYAQLARREGFEVLAIDAFADIDTVQAAHQTWQLPALAGRLTAEDAHILFEKLDAWQPEVLIIGSGFEADIACYQNLHQRYALAGNAPSVLEQVKNPYWLNSYCEAHGVLTPTVRSQAPQQGQWLYKLAGQSGGAHVSDWDESLIVSPEGYWQAFQPGLAVGALFVANQRSVTLLGVHALKQRQGDYTYAGATRLHDARLTAAMQKTLEALVPDAGLVGINSLDTIWHDGQLHVLEINPRLSASMRLYAELPLIQAHLAGTQGAVSPALQANTQYASHCILYARQAIETEDMNFPNWLEDRPDGGSVTAGQPLCSLYAQGDSTNEVQQVLQDKKTQLEKLWGTYVCERIEFNIH
ncbi:MAG: ATP-grasp domain-containing protein [Methylophilus sp.]|uniref:ATP-grasp domain-containing protein n=1 Tax=Methylophilus sp. TaxID=29541 RepID=UPI003FA0DE00